MQDAYRSVVEHYEPGDELFVGPSRGAYTARSTVGLIRDCGVLRREHAGRLKEAYGPVVTARPQRTADASDMPGTPELLLAHPHGAGRGDVAA